MVRVGGAEQNIGERTPIILGHVLERFIPAGLRTVDLRKIVIGGEGPYDAGRWADATGDLRRASMPLSDSPHVNLLQQHIRLGERLFERATFEQTPYFKNAAHAVRLCGSYFGHRTPEGIAAQARSFVCLYDRTAHGDPTEVDFTYRRRHSAPASLYTNCRRRFRPQLSGANPIGLQVVN
jgi:hypothetical protein